MKAVFTLRSHSFSTPKCCHPLRLDPVARWWSLPTSATLLSWTSSSDHLHTSTSCWSSGGQSGSCLSLSSVGGVQGLGVERASLQWQNHRWCRFPVASLHCHSWCHILLSQWPFHSSFRHFHINDLASQAEDAASRGEQGRVFKITELVCGRYRGGIDTLIMDKQGWLLTTESEEDTMDGTLQWSSEQTTTTNRGRYTRGRDRPGCQHPSPGKEEIIAAIESLKNGKIPWTRQSQCRSL